jgi:putative transposase
LFHRGVNTFLALSNEESYPGARALRKYEKKLARLQRQLARKQRFSANWKKMKARIARLHQKIARVRHDAIDKLSTNLANNHAVIVLEDLRVVNMTASAKGTPEKPGKNVKQKASLNRAILDGGWSEFVRTLSYKLTRRGGRLLEVPAHYTSQRCAGCGHVEEANRKTVDLFVCQSCGHTKNAHTQAADNILARALEKYEQELREQYPKLDLWSSPPGDTSSETATADAVPVEASGV